MRVCVCAGYELKQTNQCVVPFTLHTENISRLIYWLYVLHTRILFNRNDIQGMESLLVPNTMSCY